MESLKDRVAIVTGASRGIGLGIAAELVRWGARVCVTARRPESLADAVAELGGPEVAIAVPGKADDADHQAEVVAKTIEAFGRLDMLVNNAGINPVYGPVVDADPAAAAKILAVRSEERRVGKECRSKSSPYDTKKKRTKQVTIY